MVTKKEIELALMTAQVAMNSNPPVDTNPTVQAAHATMTRTVENVLMRVLQEGISLD